MRSVHKFDSGRAAVWVQAFPISADKVFRLIESRSEAAFGIVTLWCMCNRRYRQHYMPIIVPRIKS